MTSTSDDCDYLLKLVVIGDANVGKSSLVLRCVSSTYHDGYRSTIGLDYKIKRLVVDGKHIKICIWDTAGQERFKAVTSSYYRDADGIIVVYDITNQTSFSHVKSWMQEIEKRAKSNVNVLLVGNKNDRLEEREVFFECGKSYAEERGIPFLETSAKNAMNVELAIYTMAKDIKTRLLKENSEKSHSVQLKNAKPSASCCSYSA